MWHLPPTKSNHFDVVPKCSPIVNETHVFLGTDDGKMICVDQKSGATKWAFDVPIAGRKKIFSTPVLHEGSLYFGAYDGCVYKLDAATGKELWKFSEATWVGSSPVIDPIREFVFIGLEHKGDLSKNKGSLIALSVKDGAREFEHFVDEYIHGSPAHNKWYDLVAVGTNDSTVICVDMLGRLEWTYKTTAPVKYKPYFVEDLLIVGDHNGVVHCLDSLNGKVRWTFKTDGMIYSTPLVIGEHIFIASADKHLCKLDFDGRLIKKMYTGGENLASPVLVKGKIYLGSTSGVLQEIDPESMSQISSLQFPDKIVNAVAYSEATDMFFVTTQDTALWAIKKIT
jgi:outer membrane protein assembly factor BamB